MNFDEFLAKVDEFYNSQPFENKLRYGQTIINILHEVRPEKYKELTGTDYDCFYDDAIVRLTLDKLEKEWNNATSSV